jgi:hypothetical protein
MRSIIWAFAFAATCSSAAAQQSARECVTSALTNFTKAKSGLLQEGRFASVETEISGRRLEEQYCLQFAKCLLADQTKQIKQPNDQMIIMLLATTFSSCLRDEAFEKYQAVAG